MKDPVDLVDPLIDTANRRYFFFSSACRPFGMVNLSPDTIGRGAWEGGYRYNESHVCWFGHVHAWQLAGIPVLLRHFALDARGIGQSPSLATCDDEWCG